MNDHLPPPPPGVPGRDFPPPYFPPTPTWPHAQGRAVDPGIPMTPPPPKRNVGPVILGVLATLLAGAIIGAAVRGNNDPGDAAAPPTTTATADEPVYRPATTTTADVPSDRELQELALDMTWDETSYSDRQDVCDGVDLFGVDAAAGIMSGGADGVFDRDLLERKLVEWCNRY